MRPLTLIALAVGASVANAQSPPLTPEYELRLEPDARAVTARLEIDVQEPTAVHLLFRTEWEGYPGLELRLQTVGAWGSHGSLAIEEVSDGLGPGHRRIPVESADRVTITFRLTLGSGEAHLFHRASQLSNSGGHLIGADLLPQIWLGEPQESAQPALIRIAGLPRGWRVATVAPRAGTAYRADDIRTAIFVVGALRTRQINLGQRALTTAIYGDWPVSDERVIHAVEAIAGNLHRLASGGWGGGAHLVGVGRVPDRVVGLSTGGQVIGRTGLVYVGGNVPGELEFAQFRHTTAHELTHWYVPTAFRFYGEPPAWFAEGFTDYLALKIQLAGGLIEPQEFLDEIALRLERYQGNPLYGKTSVTEAQADFWDESAYRYIYDGGTAAAFLLDLGFQDRGRSLERSLSEARRDVALTLETLTAALAGGFRENGWVVAWAADGSNPDWEAELERYKLEWRNGSLVSLSDWATNALSTIRP